MIALLFALLPVVTGLITDRADAVPATGGAGANRGIHWITWGTEGTAIPEAGASASASATIAGGALLTTCTMGEHSGALATYRPGAAAADGLDDLYNRGGVGDQNQLVNAITTASDSAQVSFEITCAATFNGARVPLDSLVFATVGVPQGAGDAFEPFVQIEPRESSDTNWRVIDRWRDAGCESSVAAEVFGTSRVLSLSGIGASCAEGSPSVVTELSGADTVGITLHGQPRAALAIGVQVRTDFGDAPASYGMAGGFVVENRTGGDVGEGVTDVFGEWFDIGATGVTAAGANPLGIFADGEKSPLYSDDAMGDDDGGVAYDEDAGPVVLPDLSPGQTVAVSPTCLSPVGMDSYVTAWVDFNRNGVFDASERSTSAGCVDGRADLTWVVPHDLADSGPTFVRLRTSPSADVGPTGMVAAGEVEDHRIDLVREHRGISVNIVADTDTLTVNRGIRFRVEVTSFGNVLGKVRAYLPWAGVVLDCGVIFADETIACPWRSYVVTRADVAAGVLVRSARVEIENLFVPGQIELSGADALVIGTVHPELDVHVRADLQDADGDGLADVGEAIDYVYTVTNTGDVLATDITVSDDHGISRSAPCVGFLDAGHTAVCTTTSTYRVSAADAEAGSVQFGATVNGAVPTGATVTASGASSVAVDRQPAITVSIDAGASPVHAGGAVTYAFTVRNSGNATLYDVTVASPELGLAGTACVAELAAGASAACAVGATKYLTQSDIDAGVVTATVTAQGYDASGVVVADDATSTLHPPPIPKVDVQGTVSLNDGDGDGVADAGEQYDVLVAVTNTGNVTLHNLFATASSATPPQALACPDQIAPGETVTCSSPEAREVVQHDVEMGWVIVDTVVQAQSPFGETVKVPYRISLKTDSRIGLSLTASADTSVLVAGQTINHTFVLTNTGTVTLAGFVFSAPELGITSALCVPYLTPGTSAVCPVEGQLFVTQELVDRGSIEVHAAVSVDVGADRPLVASDTVELRSEQAPAAQVDVVARVLDADGDGLADLGEQVSYRYHVTNPGNVTLTDMRITDPAAGLDHAACVDRLAPGVSIDCVVAGQRPVTQADLDAGAINSTVQLSAQTVASGAVTAVGSAVLATDSSAELGIELSPSVDALVAGEAVGVRYVVTNLGTTTLYAVTVSDERAGLVAEPCVAELAPGQHAECPMSGAWAVTQADVDTGSLSGTAQAQATGSDGAAVTATGVLSVAAQQAPDISLVTTATLDDLDGDGVADVGERITYSTEASNKGNVTLGDVRVDYPSLQVVGAECVTSLAPGASARCVSTASYVVTQADADAGSLTASATVAGAAPLGDAVTATAGAVTATDSVPALALTASTAIDDPDGDGKADVGELVSVQVSVTNAGSVTLTAIAVDVPQLGVSGAPCVDSLAPGQSAQCTVGSPYVITQADVDAGAVRFEVHGAGVAATGVGVSASGGASTVTDSTAKLSAALVATLVDADGDGRADVGDSVSYHVSLTNVGTVTLQNLAVQTPAGVAVCAVELAPGAAVGCDPVPAHVVTQADIDAGGIGLAGSASAGSAEHGASTVTLSSDVPVDAVTALTVATTARLGDADGDGLADVGEVIEYQFAVTNSGTVTLGPVTLTDPKRELADAACVDGLAPGATAQCATIATYVVTQADVDAGTVATEVTASAAAVNGTAVQGRSSAVVAGDVGSDVVAATKAMLADADGDGLADVGESITYSYIVTNSGSVTLSDVVVTSAVAGLDAAACVSSLAPGTSQPCASTGTHVVTQADVDAGRIAAEATVTSRAPDGSVVGADTSTETQSDVSIAVTITKSAALDDVDGDQAADVGETIGYTFAVTNAGSVTLSGITVTDPLLGLTGAACVDVLAPGASATCTITGTHVVTQADVDSGHVTNTASASALTPWGEPTGARSSATIATDATVALVSDVTTTLVDEDGDGIADVGERIDYSVNVTNSGSLTLTSVTVSDERAGLRGAPCVASLAPGQSATCSTSASYVVTQADVDAGAIANRVTVSSGAALTASTTSIVAADAFSGLSVSVAAQLSDSDSDGKADVGETVSYVATVTNAGTTTLSAISVSDPRVVPAGAPCVDVLAAGASASCPVGTSVVTQADIDSGVLDTETQASGLAPGGGEVTAIGKSSVVVDARGAITLQVTADRDTLVVGETIGFTLTVHNEGATTVTGLVVSAPSLNLDGACVESLAPGSSVDCAVTASYVVTQADVDRGSLAVEAIVSGVAGPAGAVQAEDTWEVAQSGLAELSVAVTLSLNDSDGDGLADAGESIAAAYAVTNNGQVTLSSVQVADVALGVIALDCGGAVAPGATATCIASYAVSASDVAAGGVTSSAIASAVTGDGAEVSAYATAYATADSFAELEMTLQPSVDGSAAGNVITYTITVTNTGAVPLAPVTLDAPQLGLSAAPCAASLAPGQSVTCSAIGGRALTQADVDAGSITEVIAASGVSPTGEQAPAQTSATTALASSPAIEFESTAQLIDADGDGLADLGDSIVYEYVVGNVGNVTLHNVVIDDADNALSGAACVDSLVPGESVTCASQVTVPVTQQHIDAGTIATAPTVRASTPGGEVLSASSSTAVVAEAASGLSVTMSVDVAELIVGSQLTYGYTVTNTGAVSLSNVVITDLMTGPEGGPCVVDLPAGASAVCDVTTEYAVTQADLDAGTFTNYATAGATTPAGERVSGSAELTVTGTAMPSLSVHTTVQLDDVDDDGLADLGETITTSYSVTNTGNVTLADVVVHDAAVGLHAAPCVALLAPGQVALCSTGGEHAVTPDEVTAGEVASAPTAAATAPNGVTVTAADRVVLLAGTPTEDDVTAEISSLGAPGETVVVEVSLPEGFDPSTVTIVGLASPEPPVNVTHSVIDDGGKTLEVDGQGTWHVLPSGDISFTPLPGFIEDPTPVLFSARDADGNYLEPMLAIVDYPQVHDVVADGEFGVEVVVTPQLDDGIETATLVFRLPTDGPGAGAGTSNHGQTLSPDGKSLQVENEGIWRIEHDGSISFTPLPEFADDPSPVLYTASDAEGHYAPPAHVVLHLHEPENPGVPTEPSPTEPSPTGPSPTEPTPTGTTPTEPTPTESVPSNPVPSSAAPSNPASSNPVPSASGSAGQSGAASAGASPTDGSVASPSEPGVDQQATGGSGSGNQSGGGAGSGSTGGSGGGNRLSPGPDQRTAAPQTPESSAYPQVVPLSTDDATPQGQPLLRLGISIFLAALLALAVVGWLAYRRRGNDPA